MQQPDYPVGIGVLSPLLMTDYFAKQYSLGHMMWSLPPGFHPRMCLSIKRPHMSTLKLRRGQSPREVTSNFGTRRMRTISLHPQGTELLEIFLKVS